MFLVVNGQGEIRGNYKTKEEAVKSIIKTASVKNGEGRPSLTYYIYQQIEQYGQ